MSKADRYWIDCLHEKHECFGYDRASTVEVRHNDRVLRVLMPSYLKQVQAQVTAESGPLLFLLGKQSQEFDGQPLGVFIIAKQQEGDSYSAVVWHELYPYALKHLGLEDKS